MFQGNPNLRGIGEQIEYSEEQLKEYIRCKEDIIYFAEKYFHIISIDKGEIKIPLREYQKKILKALMNPPKRHSLISAPRQSSKTSTVSIYMTHFMIFNSEKTIAVLANKESTSIEILDRVKYAYERLPLWLQQGVESWARKSLKLENDSKIVAAASSKSAISGLSVALLYVDEFAKIPEHLAKDFMDSVFPTIYSSQSGRIILSSTPVGLNQWYVIWQAALKGSDFFPIKINWWELPWGTEEWKQTIIATFGRTHFAQEYSCVDGSSIINIRNKKTGEIQNISIEELYELQQRESGM